MNLASEVDKCCSLHIKEYFEIRSFGLAAFAFYFVPRLIANMPIAPNGEAIFSL